MPLVKINNMTKEQLIYSFQMATKKARETGCIQDLMEHTVLFVLGDPVQIDGDNLEIDGGLI